MRDDEETKAEIHLRVMVSGIHTHSLSLPSPRIITCIMVMCMWVCVWGGEGRNC